MPLPNNGYVYMSPLQQAFLNKDDGTPLSGGYILFFRDDAPTVPKSVYVQVQAPGPTYSYVDIGSQVTLSSVGTTQYLGTDTIIFMFPYQADGITLQPYYIEVYSSDNILQFTRSNWPPGAVAGSTATGSNQSQNIISNPQFSNVLFDPVNGATFSVTGTATTAIAPDWNVITTGTGTFTVNQTALTDTTIPGEPAYALDINSASLDSIILSQRITNSPRIFEGSFACGTIVAKAVSPSVNVTLRMDYVSSLPQSTAIFSGLAGDGAFAQLKSTTSAEIPQTNTNAPGASGYVDIQITIPPGAHVQISCVQLVSVADGTISVNYIQESTPRQIDHLFHYYQPQLNFKPIPSLLTGWDFALNPTQFGSSYTVGGSNAVTTTPMYIWDQTIAASAIASFNVVRSATGSGALSATSTGDTDAFYLLQYLSDGSALETTLSRLAVNISAYCSVHSGVVARAYLYYGNSSSTIPAISGGTIGALKTSPAVNGEFVLAATNWSLIAQTGKESNSGTLALNAITDLGFYGWDNTANYGTGAGNFAIVVTFYVPTSGTTTFVQSVSCVPGDIPTRPAPQTADEVLRECQYYYETSDTNGLTCPMNANTDLATTTIVEAASPFSVSYNTIKRAIPNFTVASLATTAANVSASLFYNHSGSFTTVGPSDAALGTYWATPVIGNKSLYALPKSITSIVTLSLTSTGLYCSGCIQFTYVLDSRLGVV